VRNGLWKGIRNPKEDQYNGQRKRNLSNILSETKTKKENGKLMVEKNRNKVISRKSKVEK
jgi:hypothetical protein